MKNAIITGGGSGIGRAIAERIAQDGNHVVIIDLQEETGEETVALIKETGGSAECLQCDVSDTESVRAVFEKIPLVDILVNCAGIASI